MFGRRQYKVDLNIEGELQAMTVSRKEGYKSVNPKFDRYPVNLELPKKMTFKEAIKKMWEYNQAGIYTILYKGRRRPENDVEFK